jgi:hypothetical protein
LEIGALRLVGINPAGPPDELEKPLLIALHERVNAELKRASDGR